MSQDFNQRLDKWIDDHFDEQTKLLQELIRVPTDSPPGNNAPHAKRTVELFRAFGYEAEEYPVPEEEVKKHGLQSITNLVYRRKLGQGTGPTIAMNAHGDVVPPGEGWKHDPYGGEIDNGRLYGRAAAVSKCDFTTYAFATRALEAVAQDERKRGGNDARFIDGNIELLFTYDEEFGGEVGPAWLLRERLTKPDFLIAAGFSYQVITAHNGCLQLEVTVHGTMAHAAIPDSGVDALQGATKILNALYAQNEKYRQVRSQVNGITHPYLNVGMISGGTNTNVIPGKVVLKLDRRMIPEEKSSEVEADVRKVITDAAASYPGIKVEIRRMLLAEAWKPRDENAPLVGALQKNASEVFGEQVPALGTPLYTDVRLFGSAGVPAAIYGAGPRTVLESNAKRADEHIVLEDLRRATKVVARSLADLMTVKKG